MNPGASGQSPGWPGQRARLDRSRMDRVGARNYGLGHFRYLVFGDPAWTVAQFNFASDIVRAEALGRVHRQHPRSQSAAILRSRRQADSVPRLERSADFTLATARSTTAEWCEALGGARSSESLPTVHGAGHGPLRRRRRSNTFEMVGALEEWVEHGKAPAASPRHMHQQPRRSDAAALSLSAGRVYKGTGSTDDAANFVCRVP